jgi:hypothetical protein
VVLGLLVAACGASAVTPTPTPPPVVVVPTPTPDLHIIGPTDANRVFQILAASGLPVHQESLGAPGPKGEPRLTLFIVADAVPIAIGQYSSPQAVAAAGYRPGSAVAKGDAPVELWTGNVVLHIGDQTPGRMPAPPPDFLTSTAQRIADVLDPYLGPLNQRAVQPVVLPSQAPTASPSARPSAPPSAKPKTTPRPKATKRP